MSKFVVYISRIRLFSNLWKFCTGLAHALIVNMSNLRQIIGKSLAVNDPLTAASEFFEAFAALHPHVVLLGPANSLVRRDFASLLEVKILSGGPTGNEPLYSGFIGKGFLTAAIHGDILASPPSTEIVKIIRFLVQPRDSGMLIVIQNNRNDVLNFSLAMTEARTLGLNVKLVIVDDDFSENVELYTGLSGIVLVQKVAGALADMGELGLEEIYQICNQVKSNLWSVEVSVKGLEDFSEEICRCAKNPTDTNMTTSEVIEETLRTLHKYLDTESDYVLLVNTYRMSKIEESIFVSQFIKAAKEENFKMVRAYAGTFMGNLEGKGFVVSVMKVDELILSCLDHPTQAVSWRSNFRLDEQLPTRLKPSFKTTPIEHKGPKLTERQVNILHLVLQFVCDALISCDRQLNVIDSELGDGDTGTRLKLLCEDVLEGLRVKKIVLDNCYVFFKTLSRCCREMGSVLGTIYGIIFEAAAQTAEDFDETEEIDYKFYLQCLESAVVLLKSFTQCDDCYMLGPLSACLVETKRALEDGQNAVEAFSQGVFAAEEAALRSKRHGRVFPDPGAHAVGIWMRAAIEGIKLRCEY